jgi:hypothetical protein
MNGQTDSRPTTAPAVAALVAALLAAGCATVAVAPGSGAVTAAAPAAPATGKPAVGPAAAASSAASRPQAATGGATAPPRPQAATPPGSPPPFAEVTKDAKRSEGFLAVWTREDRTWLEVPAELLDKPFFLGTSLASGLGERFAWPGLMGPERAVVLRRIGNGLQMVARNLHPRGPAGTPLALALEESYSDSLVAAVPLAAAPHPDRKSLLVDAMALLGGDINGAQSNLEAAFRLPYALDRGNSGIVRSRTNAEGTSITVRQHFAIPKLPASPQAGPGGAPPNPAMLPSPPRAVPDARSFFVNVAYTMAPLPAEPMRTRRADPRVGYFTDAYIDFGDERSGDRRTHLINRWRLEKKDPAAEVSEPKQPIRVVMDRNIPEKWRAAVREGILEWNKAFERAGFRDAIAVEQQPVDADWSTLEGTRLLAVRWFALEGPGATAVGPSQTDPRTGEILRGAAIIPENWARLDRSRLMDTRPPIGSQALEPAALPGDFARRYMHCSFASDALENAAFGFELLAARGEIDPQGADADRFIAASLKSVTMHEIGHALGLRHNFKGSTGISLAQLRDRAFTAQRGLANSIMDYVPLNLPLRGEPAGDIHKVTLGAYDHWAIEYGYREIAVDREAEELAALARRGERDASLAYATDEDAAGPDPNVLRFDLGDDPLAWAARQTRLARELWQRTAERTLPPDDDMTVYRRNLQRVMATLGQAVPMAVRHIGGTLTSRATAGAGIPVLQPVPAARQREALALVVGEVFSSQSFRFEPELMSRLAVDHLDRVGQGRFMANTDYSLPEEVLGLQRGVLDSLMSEALAVRLAAAEVKVADPRTLVSYAEVQDKLAAAVWSELKPVKGSAREIDTLRRNLQREHLRRLAGGLLRPSSGVAADVRSVNRQVALSLEKQLRAALAAGGWSALARAHLDESLATIGEALKAPLVRQGV